MTHNLYLNGMVLLKGEEMAGLKPLRYPGRTMRGWEGIGEEKKERKTKRGEDKRGREDDHKASTKGHL